MSNRPVSSNRLLKRQSEPETTPPRLRGPVLDSIPEPIDPPRPVSASDVPCAPPTAPPAFRPEPLPDRSDRAVANPCAAAMSAPLPSPEVPSRAAPAVPGSSRRTTCPTTPRPSASDPLASRAPWRAGAHSAAHRPARAAPGAACPAPEGDSARPGPVRGVSKSGSRRAPRAVPAPACPARARLGSPLRRSGAGGRAGRSSARGGSPRVPAAGQAGAELPQKGAAAQRGKAAPKAQGDVGGMAGRELGPADMMDARSGPRRPSGAGTRPAAAGAPAVVIEAQLTLSETSPMTHELNMAVFNE